MLHFYNQTEDVGLSKEEVYFLGRELGHKGNTKISLRDYSRKIKNPFLNTVIRIFLESKSAKHNEKWKTYFASMILELQEYRNAKLHSGRINNYSEIKMNELIPGIMTRVRIHLLDRSKKNNKLTFSELIRDLTTG